MVKTNETAGAGQKATIPIVAAMAVAIAVGVMYITGFQGVPDATIPPADVFVPPAGVIPPHNAPSNMTSNGASGIRDISELRDDNAWPHRYFAGTNEIIRISTQEDLQDVIMASEFLWDYQGYGYGERLRATAGSVVDFGGNLQFQSALREGSDSSMAAPAGMMAPTGASSSSTGADHSTTNIQVEGVDEPDYIKNDGKYVYVVSKNTLIIMDAYPAKDARIILKSAFDIEDRNIRNMFLNGDRLVVFYDGQRDHMVIEEFGYAPTKTNGPATHALIIDITDKERPDILRDYSIDGGFRDARMIGDYVYFVTNSRIDSSSPEFPVVAEGSRIIERPNAFYFDNLDDLTTFSTLTAIDIFDETVSSETFLTGQSGTFYVSEDNFYITYQSNNNSAVNDRGLQRDRFFEAIVPLLPYHTKTQIMEVQMNDDLTSKQKWDAISGIMQDSYNKMSDAVREALFREIKASLGEYDTEMLEYSRMTIIHKIAIDGSDIEYVAKGSVPGKLLNQFSMDEHGDRFRVATNIEYYHPSEGNVRYNAVYVLDEDLNTVGELGDIAPTEWIYSARFIEDRLYLVTFKKVDPFFVIDLSTDTPKILGELKIPGYSDYLHPYDENHIIGVGKDTTDHGDFALFQGVKIAIFNVEDVKNPRVADDVIIGKRGTESGALYDHKAFFFDRASGLLSIPIVGNLGDLGEVGGSESKSVHDRWRGFYVYDLTDKKFDLQGTITHSVDDGYRSSNGRTFYIDDVLYTVSVETVKMNLMDGLGEVNTIRFDNTGRLVGYLE